jgi:simple sugar transport system permease protein
VAVDAPGIKTTRGGRGGEVRAHASTLRFRELTLLPAIALAIIAGALISDAFLTTNNFLNILQQSSELSVLVIAQ